MKLLSFAETPVQYHIDVYRRLAADPETSFHAIFRSQGFASGNDNPTRHPVWGDANIANTTGLLEGYPSTCLETGSTFEIASALRKLGARRGDGLLMHTVLPRTSRRMAVVGSALGLRMLFRGSSYHSPHEPPLKNRLRAIRDRVSLTPYDAFCASGTVTWKFFERYGGGKPIVFAPYCPDEYVLDEVAKTYAERRASTRKKLGIGTGEVLVVFAGRFSPEKNLFNLLRGFAQTQAADLHLHLAGDGPQRDAITKTISALSFAGSEPSLLGFLSRYQMLDLFCASDVLALPSYSETWGVVVNEALRLGNVCMVSDAVGSSADLIVAGTNGVVIDPHDAGSISSGLLACAELARGGGFVDLNQQLSQIFSADNTVDGILSAWRGEIADDRPRPPGLRATESK